METIQDVKDELDNLKKRLMIRQLEDAVTFSAYTSGYSNFTPTAETVDKVIKRMEESITTTHGGMDLVKMCAIASRSIKNDLPCAEFSDQTQTLVDIIQTLDYLKQAMVIIGESHDLLHSITYHDGEKH